MPFDQTPESFDSATMTSEHRNSDPHTIVLLGIPFHDLSMEETLDLIDRLVQERRAAYIATANLDFATQAGRDVELQRILVEAEVVLCDGTPLVWASRLTGKPLRQRVAGSDLVPRLAERSAQRGHRMFFLGGRTETLEKAAEAFKSRYPGLEVCGTYSPPVAPLHDFDNEEIARRISDAKPDILLVAFGCPKQEKWIYANYRKLGVPCSIGIGASLDFIAGKVVRAPAWMGKLGLEWLFRLAQEPGRLASRYFSDFIFLFVQLAREQLSFRTVAAPAEPGASKPLPAPDHEEITWQGRVTAANLAQMPLPALDRSFTIDLSRVEFIDSSGVGLLLKTIRRAWTSGLAGCLVAPSSAVRDVFRATRLDRVLPIADDMAAAGGLLRQETTTGLLRPVADAETAALVFQTPAKLTAENADDCWSVVRSEWEKKAGLKILCLDLASTRFMDSSGLGFLVRCKRMAGERNSAELLLRHLPPNVRNVIRVSKLQNVLGVPDA